MNRDPSIATDQNASDAFEVARPRRPYRKPELVAYGRVEDMTRAGKKSGQEASKKPRV